MQLTNKHISPEQSMAYRRSKTVAFGLILFGLVPSFLSDAIPIIWIGIGIQLIGVIILTWKQIQFKQYRDFKYILFFLATGVLTAVVLWIYFHFA